MIFISFNASDEFPAFTFLFERIAPKNSSTSDSQESSLWKVVFSSSSQVAAIAALNDNLHLEQTIKLNSLEMKKMYKKLDQLNLNYIDSVANFITIIFKTREEVLNCTQYLLKNGVIVRDLIGFGLPHCIRVTIGKANENKIFINKLESLF